MHARASTNGVDAAVPVGVAEADGVADTPDGENANTLPSVVAKNRWPSATAGDTKTSEAPVL